MGQWVKAQGHVKVAKKCKNTSTCDDPPSKCQTKNKKNYFFRCQLKDLLNPEGLNSSLALAAVDLWPNKGEPIYWLAQSSGFSLLPIVIKTSVGLHVIRLPAFFNYFYSQSFVYMYHIIPWSILVPFRHL